MLRLSKRYNSFLSQLLNSKTVHELLLTTEAPTTPTTVQGWVRSFRPLKNVSFIDLQDGTSNEALKIVVPNTNGSLPSLKTGQSIVVSNAAWRWTPNREQPFELSCSPSDLRIVGDITPEYPLQKKHTTLKQLRQWPLWKHRTTYLGGLMRFRSHLERELFNILSNEGVYRVHTPILTGVDCEGAGELFNVGSKSNQNYFGKETYLTVSTQLHLEILALAMNRVWSLSPCFRAEGSDTSRHLAEFWMLEAEVCFMDNVHQLTAFLEHLLKSLINSLIENHSNLIPQLTPQDNVSPGTKVLEKWQSLVAKKWENITYTEATELLKAQHSRSAFVHPPEWGNALQSEHEKWLAECKFNGPVFVMDYPHSCKAFYMKRGEDGKTATCFDLLVPGMGEISSGSIREDNYDKLITSMQERQMNLEQMKWYTDLRKQGSLPHGGFGIGMERLVTWLYGAHNVRDSIPFHRSATSAIEL